jgi:hypothetical protein
MARADGGASCAMGHPSVHTAGLEPGDMSVVLGPKGGGRVVEGRVSEAE